MRHQQTLYLLFRESRSDNLRYPSVTSSCFLVRGNYTWVRKMNTHHTEEDKVAKSLGLYVLRSVNTIVALITAVAVLWIKANVPSKQDFLEFQAQVRSIELNVVQLRQTNERIADFESRIRVLERQYLKK